MLGVVLAHFPFCGRASNARRMTKYPSYHWWLPNATSTSAHRHAPLQRACLHLSWCWRQPELCWYLMVTAGHMQEGSGQTSSLCSFKVPHQQSSRCGFPPKVRMVSRALGNADRKPTLTDALPQDKIVDGNGVTYGKPVEEWQTNGSDRQRKAFTGIDRATW